MSFSGTLIALHGFLGRPEDWKSVGENLSFPLRAIDYLSVSQLKPQNTNLQAWGKSFNKFIQEENPPKPWVLMGYSLGGRLSLSALKAEPNFWAGAIFLSTHYGLSSLEEKSQRQKNDKVWAKRFFEEPFQKILTDWNQQAVFQGSSKEPFRQEDDYQREDLANALTRWSLSEQDSALPWLNTIKKPCLWVTGARDKKFTDLTMSLKNSEIEKVVLPEASHRVHLDDPRNLSQIIQRFCKKLENKKG